MVKRHINVCTGGDLCSLFFSNFSETPFMKDFRVVLLSRSLLNFLRTFASLIRSSLFEFGKILPHPRGIRQSFFAPGQGIRQKKIAQVAGISLLKKISPGLPGGCTQLELTET